MPIKSDHQSQRQYFELKHIHGIFIEHAMIRILKVHPNSVVWSYNILLIFRNKMNSIIYTFPANTSELFLFHINCTHINYICYVHKIWMLNSIFLDHGSSNKIDLPVTLFINISAALSMCVNHDHTHSIEKNHSRRKKETQTMQANTDANSEDCLSKKLYIYLIHTIF